MADTDHTRCAWATTDAMIQYHDDEWGVPSRDDQHLFEMLILEGAQAGLSWSTILNKREGYRALFAGFDIDKVARFTEKDIERIVLDARVVRNRAKIESAVLNARAVQQIQQEHGSFADFVWSFVDGKTIDTPRDAANPTPASTPESDALSKALKKYGCKFIGTTICYAFMQATGLVNDHAAGCISRGKAKTKRKAAAKSAH
jgi:DNA-3-methyladenine glycosylase I